MYQGVKVHRTFAVPQTASAPPRAHGVCMVPSYEHGGCCLCWPTALSSHCTFLLIFRNPTCCLKCVPLNNIQQMSIFLIRVYTLQAQEFWLMKAHGAWCIVLNNHSHKTQTLCGDTNFRVKTQVCKLTLQALQLPCQALASSSSLQVLDHVSTLELVLLLL